MVVELYDTGAFLDLILRGIRGIINRQVKEGVETKLCQVQLPAFHHPPP